jgi:hypothetical protein
VALCALVSKKASRISLMPPLEWLLNQFGLQLLLKYNVFPRSGLASSEALYIRLRD